MKKINSKISKTFYEHEMQIFTLYPNELVNFLGGIEQLNKINLFGHRIIFVMMEMLKNIQVHKISIADTKDIIHNDLIIKDGRMISLEEIKAEEIEKKRVLESGKKLAIIEEEFFADNFSMLQMVITTKALNDNGNIKVKDNSVFHEQLKVFKTLGNHNVKSNFGEEILLTNFIETPVFNKGQNYIRFYISKATSRMLMNNIDGYLKVYRNLLFSNSSERPLNVYLYIKKKFGKMNGGNIKIEKFVSELNLAEHYLKKSKLSVFLDSIQKNLNEVNNISFGFKILDDNINFQLYETNNTIGVEYSTNENYQAENALKYIKKKRSLNDKQMVYIKGKFTEHGYTKMNIITKKRLDKNILGNDYLKWFVDICLENNL